MHLHAVISKTIIYLYIYLISLFLPVCQYKYIVHWLNQFRRCMSYVISKSLIRFSFRIAVHIYGKRYCVEGHFFNDPSLYVTKKPLR